MRFNHYYYLKTPKNNYNLIKAYCPMMLLDTIEKTFESILARKISAITKIYHLLTDTHFSGKKNIPLEYVIYFLVEKKYAA